MFPATYVQNTTPQKNKNLQQLPQYSTIVTPSKYTSKKQVPAFLPTQVSLFFLDPNFDSLRTFWVYIGLWALYATSKLYIPLRRTNQNSFTGIFSPVKINSIKSLLLVKQTLKMV